MLHKQILSTIWLLDKSSSPTHRVYRTFLTSKKKSWIRRGKECECKTELEREKDAKEKEKEECRRKVALAKSSQSSQEENKKLSKTCSYKSESSEIKSYKPLVYDENVVKHYTNPCKQQQPCVAYNPHPIHCQNTVEQPLIFKVTDSCPPAEPFAVKLRKYLIILGYLFGAYFCYKYFFTPEKNEGVKLVSRKRRSCLPPREDQMKEPSTSGTIPSRIKYLMIGGGTATFSAIKAIKTYDPTAKVLVVSKEPFVPYKRPPLSKELYNQEDREAAGQLKYLWNGEEESVFYEPPEFYDPVATLKESEAGGVSIVKGWEVKNLNPKKKEAILDDGKIIKYEKCLIATGGEPKTLPSLEDAKEEIQQMVTLYRGVNDYREIEELFEHCDPKSVAIVGGGLLGSELAVALAKKGEPNNIKVTQIVRGPGPLIKILPAYLAKYVGKRMSGEGVEILADVEVDDVILQDEQLRLILSNDSNIIADHVIVAVGIEPNTDLAEGACLEVDKERGGYLVNTQMLASSDVYVAGDCASYCDQMSCKRRREEHHENAIITGRIAGENMTGRPTSYDTQPVFRSDIIESALVFEGVGTVDSTLPTVGIFAEPKPDDAAREDGGDKKGVMFYLKNDLVVGILLVNLPDKTGVARQVLMEKVHYKDFNEVAKRFDIHGQEADKEAPPVS